MKKLISVIVVFGGIFSLAAFVVLAIQEVTGYKMVKLVFHTFSGLRNCDPYVGLLIFSFTAGFIYFCIGTSIIYVYKKIRLERFLLLQKKLKMKI